MATADNNRRPEYARIPTPTEMGNTLLTELLGAPEPATSTPEPAPRLLKIAARTREVSLTTGTYTVTAKVFSLTSPLPLYASDCSEGLYAAVTDGGEGDAYVHFDGYTLEQLMNEVPKKKSALAFADANYEAFAKIIDDLNRAGCYLSRGNEPFIDTREALRYSPDNRVRVYEYRYASER